MRDNSRRYFMKEIGLVVAGSLLIPSSAFALTTAEKRDYFSKDSNQTLLARMIFGETRNLLKLDEAYREPTMVGFTALNRAREGMKCERGDLRGALLAREQYSCFNSNDPNFKRINAPEDYDKDSWIKAQIIARRLLTLEGALSHLNYGQTHYCRKNMKKPPSWTKSPRMGKVWVPSYFAHDFYKEERSKS